MQKNHDLKNWLSILEHLIPDLQGPLNQIEIHLDDSEENFVLSGDEASILEIEALLVKNLASPDGMLANLPYRIEGQPTYKTHTEYKFQTPEAPQQGEGVEILARIFGEEFSLREERGVKLVWKNLFEEKTDKPLLLSGDPLPAIYGKIMWEGRVNEIADNLSNLTIYEIRDLYTNTHRSFEEYTHLGHHTLDLDLVKMCFGYTDTSEGTCIYFDYPLFYNLLYPPAITLDANTAEEENKLDLNISKDHLIAYIRQVLPGFLIKNQNSAIFTPDLSPSLDEMHLVLLIDSSGSMEAQIRTCHEEAYKLVKNFHSLHETEAKNIDIDIVSFSSRIKQIQSFKLNELDSIETYINSIQASGGTRLYGTIKEAKEELFGTTDIYRQNITFLLMTDGEENPNHKKDGSKEALEKDKQNLPQIFSIGIGPNHDRKTCQEIAEKTGGEYININSVEDLSRVEAYFEEISQFRTLVELITGGEELFLSVYSSPVEVQGIDTANFSLNGKSYVITPKTEDEPSSKFFGEQRESLVETHSSPFSPTT